MPTGYYNWSYGNSSCCIPTETKTVTAGTSATTVTPTNYNTASQYVKFLKSVTVNPTPSQAKTVAAKLSNVTVSPDSGKLLSGVTVTPNVEKIWTNSSPNSSMEYISLRISAGITAYKYIFFRFKCTTSLSQYEQLIGINTTNYTKYSISVSNLGTLKDIVAYALINGSHSVMRPIQWFNDYVLYIERPIVITGNSDGSVHLHYKGNSTHWGYTIPLECYGIKA